MIECCHDADGPVSFAGGELDPYRHVCAFVDSPDEMFRIFDPFIAEGLERGDRLSFIVNPNEKAAWVLHFRQLHLDIHKLLDAGRFEVRSWAEAFDRDSQFDKEGMLRLLDDLLGSSRSPRIRLVSKMGWIVDQDSADDLLEFEARANYLLPNHEHVVICIYDRARFSGDVMIDVLRTHPMALIGGILQVNPFFVPPAEFLAELRSRNRPATDG